MIVLLHVIRLLDHQVIGQVAVRVPPRLQVYLIDRPGLTQASVALGEVGVSLTDPDHYALDVLNDILNSFGGKLFDQIRSREVRPNAPSSPPHELIM